MGCPCRTIENNVGPQAGRRLTIAMALATQCPYCHTKFKVAHDQLKLRAGLVRCGACKQVFNGTEHLLAADAPLSASQNRTSLSASISGSPAMPATSMGNHPGSPQASLSDNSQAKSFVKPLENAVFENPRSADLKTESQLRIPPSDSGELRAVSAEDPSALTNQHPNTAMPPRRTASSTLTALASGNSTQIANSIATQNDVPHSADPISDASLAMEPPASPNEDGAYIEDLEARPAQNREKRGFFSRTKKHVHSDPGEPGFVTRARRQERMGKATRSAMGIASLILFLGLIGQGIYAFREQIAARWPESAAALRHACELIDCRIGLPSQIDMLTIESNELQALTPEHNAFVLIALLRNYSALPQSWPNLELTLNDAEDKPIARRVFAPSDYLPAIPNSAKGFPPNSEQVLKLYFTLSQLKPSGYRVYLFYP